MNRSVFFQFASLLILSLTTSAVYGQNAWEAPLRQLLVQFDTVNSQAGMDRVVASSERIALSTQDAWLPNYYAAYFNILKHYAAGDEGCSECLDKAWDYLERADNLEADNAELVALMGSYYPAMLVLYPMRAPVYGPKAGKLLAKARALDPSNPRAASLLGQNTFYTPSMWGGGAERARPDLQAAVDLFELEAQDTERSDLLPRWGAERAAAMLQRANHVLAAQ